MSHVVRKEMSTKSDVVWEYSVGSWRPASSKAEAVWDVVESFDVPRGAAAVQAKSRAYALCSYLNGGHQPFE